MAATYAYPAQVNNDAAYPWQDASAASTPFSASVYEASYHDSNAQQNNNQSSTSSSVVHKKQTPGEIQDMKVRRKRRTVASGVAGGVLGLVVLGPVGGILGGVGGAVVAKRVGKRNEKRRMDQIEARQNPLQAHEGEML